MLSNAIPSSLQVHNHVQLRSATYNCLPGSVSSTEDALDFGKQT